MTNVKQLFLPIQHFSERNRQFKEVQKLKESLLEKLEGIHLPGSLKFELSKFIMPVGLQLLKWFTNSFAEYCHPYDISRAGGVIYWTVEGTIDKVRSLKELIAYKDKDLHYLFELACRYCLENCILDLWIKIIKLRFKEITSLNLTEERRAIYDGYDDHIVMYWSAVLENELDSLLTKIMPDDYYNIYDNSLSINENMVSLSILVGNVFSLKYFWHKLTELQKTNNIEKWLIRIFHSNDYAKYDGVFKDMLCFLLTHLDDQNQRQLFFETYSSLILETLIHIWPHQRFFLPTICAMFDFMSEDIYVKVMFRAAAIERKKNEVNVFSGVWRSTPVRFKNAFLQYPRLSAKVILSFFCMGDVEAAKMMLDDAANEKQKQIIFRMTRCTEFYELAYSSRYALIIPLVSEILSDSDINSFKLLVLLNSVEMLQYISSSIYGRRKNKFQANEEFLKWTFQPLYETNDFEKASVKPTDCYTLLALTGNYELVDEFMNWYFKTEEEIKLFKSSFIDEKCASMLKRHDFLITISKLVNGWDVFEKFINYNLCSSEKIHLLIKQCLNFVNSFLWERNFTFPTLFLNWYFSSSDDIHIFKNDFIVSGWTPDLLSCTSGMWPDRAKEIIEWFCPLSKATTTQLKLLVHNNIEQLGRSDKEDNKVAFSYLLDSVTGEDVTKYEEPSLSQLINNIKSICGEKITGNISEDVSGVAEAPLDALLRGSQFRIGDSLPPSNITLEQSRVAFMEHIQWEINHFKDRDQERY